MKIEHIAIWVNDLELIKDFVERQRESRVFFLFTPEGTRGKSEKWKTGFYHVAQGCNIPIFLAKVDYRMKESGVFHSYQLTDDKDEDICSIQASYKSVYGKFPERQFPPYVGPIPALSDADAVIMKAMYSLKGVATRVEIATKAKRLELSTSMLDFLITKGILEKITQKDEQSEPKYKLTFAGKGCLLHLYPTLVTS